MLTAIAINATIVIAAPTTSAWRSVNSSPSVASRTIRRTSYWRGSNQLNATTEQTKPTTQPLRPSWGAAGTSVTIRRKPAGTIGRTGGKPTPSLATGATATTGIPAQ